MNKTRLGKQLPPPHHTLFMVGDEVGRGCLGGPALVCSFFAQISSESSESLFTSLTSLHQFLINHQVDDSKALNTGQRLAVLERFNLPMLSKIKLNQLYPLPLPMASIDLYFCLRLVPVMVIDQLNILRAILEAFACTLACALEQLPNIPGHLAVVLDGKISLDYLWRSTDIKRYWERHLSTEVPMTLLERAQWGALVKADQQIALCSLASLLAKEYRDRVIIPTLDLEFPQYQFHRHKGYGTALHRQMIHRLGPIPGIHRNSFKLK